jgi:hypothetical protein
MRSSAFASAAKEDKGDDTANNPVAPICCKNFLLEFESLFFIAIV